jgi:predicted O-methyltransferase YrrM
MSKEQWSAVDDYLVKQLIPADAALAAAQAANAEAGLPAIDVSPNFGRFLHLIARMTGARRVLEIGTLGGYSTIWLARALPPGGSVVSLEALARHAEIARSNIARAGLADRVDIRVGKALDILPKLAAEDRGSFDLIFIDADKENNRAYLEWALKLSRPGSVIIVDNVVRDGAVTDAGSRDTMVQGTRQMFDRCFGEPRLTASALQTVGVKGWDGFLFGIVN